MTGNLLFHVLLQTFMLSMVQTSSIVISSSLTSGIITASQGVPTSALNQTPLPTATSLGAQSQESSQVVTQSASMQGAQTPMSSQVIAPASSQGAQPQASSQAAQSVSSHSAQQPVLSQAPPASSQAAPPPASSQAAPPPASSQAAPPPASSQAAPPPASSQVAPPPASSQAAPQPATSQAVPLAASSHSANPPASSQVAPPPASSHVAQSPAASVSQSPTPKISATPIMSVKPIMSSHVVVQSVMSSKSIVATSSSATSVVVPQVTLALNEVEGFTTSLVFTFLKGSEKIALSAESGFLKDGVLKQSTKTGWISLDQFNTTAAPVISGERLRFDPSADGFKGGISLNFSIVITNKTTIDVNSLHLYNLVILVPPTKPLVKFPDGINSFNTSSPEDFNCQYIKIDVKEHPVIPTNTSLNVPDIVLPLIKSTAYQTYLKMVNSFADKFKPALWFRSIDTNHGKWFYNNTVTKTRIPNTLPTQLILGVDNQYCVEPDLNFNGLLQNKVSPVLISKLDNTVYTGSQVLSIYWQISSVNDRPEINKNSVQAPVLPYNISSVSAEGFTVKEMVQVHISQSSSTTVASDPDTSSSSPGIAIISGVPSTYGHWEYNCTGSWVQINLTNTKPLGRNGSFTAILLKPTDKIRFKLNGNKFWNTITAAQQVKFDFFAWDGSDNLNCGVNVFNSSSGMPPSISQSRAKCIQLRKGCDGNAGTVATLDGCGVCGGDNSTCLGCDGVLNSGAVLNNCLNCTGGNTGRAANYSIDCAGTCGQSFFDNCGVCQVKAAFVNQTDCAGVCSGTALLNKCGNCAGGTSGKISTFGEDACGICDGNNSTCKDCAGVPNGGKMKDLCGNCLLPNDTAYNAACVKLGGFQPRVGSVSGGDAVTIKASGLAAYKSVLCSTIKNSVSVNAKSSSLKKDSNLITMTTSTASAGIYTINCTLTGDGGNKVVTAVGTFQFIDESKMKITSVSPNVTNVNTNATLTLTGSDFVNSSELVCLYGKKHQVFAATYISATQVTCQLLEQKQSIISDLVVSFIASGRTKINGLSVKHYISVNVPTVKSAAFSQQLGKVEIHLSARAEFKSKSMSCAEVFKSNYTQFGSKSQCKLTGNVLKIKLVGGPTLTPGYLHIDLTTIIAKGAEHTVYPMATQKFNVAGPPNDISPNIKLVGSTIVGSCDPIKMKMILQGGGGGRKLAYQWSVKWGSQNAGSASSAAQAKLTSLNATLSALPSSTERYEALVNATFIGFYLEFTVKASNFLGKTSSSSLIVYREDKTLPQVSLDTNEIVTKVNIVNSITATVELSDCIDTSIYEPKFTFQWQIEPSVGITLDNPNLNKLVIGEGKLKAGTTYKVTVVVAMEQSDELSVTQSAKIKTLSSDLVASIKGQQTIGSAETLKLDASKSFDPDGEAGSKHKFNWRVTNSDNSAVIVAGKAVTIPSTSSVSIDVAKSLKSGKDYIFTLTYRVGKRIAIATQTVSVVAGEPPNVQVTRILDKVNPSKKLELSATITSATDGTYEWTSVEVDDSTKTFASIDLSESELLTGKTGTMKKGKAATATIVIKADVLSSSVWYRFKLSATNVDATAEDIIDVEINGAPTAGVVTVSPVNGLALNTTFTITATEGWSDPNGDDISFVFGYRSNGNVVLFAPQKDTTYGTQLPPGNLTMLVYCYDTYQAFSLTEFDVYVATAPVDFNEKTKTMEKAAGSCDVNALLVNSVTIMLAAELANSGGEKSDAQKAFQSDVSKLVLKCVGKGAIQDEETKRQLIKGLSSLTNGAGKDFDNTLISSIIANIALILQNGGGSSRKRRAVSSSVSAKTPTQVEQDMMTYVNLIDPSVYDSNSQNKKSSFLTTLDSLTASMCKNYATGEAAGIAKTSLVVLQTINKDFDDVDTKEITLGCSDCPTYRNGSEFVLLGAGLKSIYGSFQCDSGETCTGLCVSSAQFPNDLVSSSFNSSMLSGVLAIKFWNPSTQAEIVMSSIPQGMIVRAMPTKSTNNSYLCHRWDGTKWDLDGVETITAKSYSYSNGSYVTCNMTKVGYLALFEGPAIITPTSSSVTTMSSTPVTNNTVGINATASISATPSSSVMSSSITTTAVTTTLAPENFPRKVAFTFPTANCTALFNASTKASFTNSLKLQVANAAKLNVSTMSNFSITCGSIIVNYEQQGTSNQTAAAAEAAIKTAVQTNSLNITINGQQLSADSTSYSSSILTPNYATTTAPPVVVVDDDGLSGGAIAGIVIGVLIILVIILALAYFLCIRKNSRKDPTVDPNANTLELRGKTNETYTDSP